MSKVPFTIEDYAFHEFTIDLTLYLGENPVTLSLGYSEWSGWEVHEATDAFGDEVDTDLLARRLGFDDNDELFAALTDGVFGAHSRQFELLTKNGARV
jgi:hypothetical protein